jgi:cell division transport system permease protein
MSQNKHYKRKVRASYFTTMVSISLVLFMLGILGFLLLSAEKVANRVKENIKLSILISDEGKENDIIKLQKHLDRQDYIKETQYVSKEEAAKTLSNDLGEDFISFLGYNPLKSSIEIYVKSAYANNDSLKVIKNQIVAHSAIIEEVQYHEPLVQAINNNIRKISLIITAFSAILALISLVLINNTIRLFVYSKRFIIRTMQLVGATEFFIRKPFVRRGIFQGFLSALLAIGMIITSLYFAHKEVPELFDVEFYDTILILFAAVIIVGMLLSWIASYFSVRKYLRINVEDLYY